ncbi:MAG: hypothetical protein NDI81_20230 [Desulfobacula sp.]|nr:hypothetical protein [Desulfobacula sp.]
MSIRTALFPHQFSSFDAPRIQPIDNPSKIMDLEIRRQLLEKYIKVKGNIEKAPGIKKATKAGMDI